MLNYKKITSADQLIPGRTYFLQQDELVGSTDFQEVKYKIEERRGREGETLYIPVLRSIVTFCPLLRIYNNRYDFLKVCKAHNIGVYARGLCIMKIIDKQNKKYTKPEDFSVGDFFFDEISGDHFWISSAASLGYACALVNLDLGSLKSIDDSPEEVIYHSKSMNDTSHLVKISPDKVTMTFNRKTDY